MRTILYRAPFGKTSYVFSLLENSITISPTCSCPHTELKPRSSCADCPTLRQRHAHSPHPPWIDLAKGRAVGGHSIRKCPPTGGPTSTILFHLDGVATATPSFSCVSAWLCSRPGIPVPVPPGRALPTGQWCCSRCPPADAACRSACRAWIPRSYQ